MKKIVVAVLVCCAVILGCKDKSKSDTPVPSEDEMELEAVETLSKLAEEASEEVDIIPIEHATAVVDWGDVTLYIDPVGGAGAFEGQKLPDLILITDIHGDHLSVETLQALDTQKAKIIAPQAVADKLPKELMAQVDVLNNGETEEYNGISISAIPMYNLRQEALKFHEKGRGNGYVLEKDDLRIYFSGDTEDIPEMRALKDIDKAFICMNLPYTMTVESAAEAVLEFKPKQVYPYHYRGNPAVGDVEKFKELVHAGNPDIEVIQLDWYPKEAY